MSDYAMKAVSRLTGLTPETLRAWERRYGVVSPARTDGGHRVYSAADVDDLRLLKQLVDAGHGIGRLAAMDRRERRQLAQELDVETAPDQLSGLRNALIDAVRNYDAAALETRLGVAFAALPADLMVERVLGPFLAEVGEGWHRGDLDIAQERLASSVIRARLMATLNGLPDLAPAMLLATPSGERHELGLLMFAYRAAARLIPLRFLGADLPLAEVGRLARRFRPRVVALSLVNPPPAGLETELEALSGQVSRVWLGGRRAADIEGELPGNCRVLADDDAIRGALDEISVIA